MSIDEQRLIAASAIKKYRAGPTSLRPETLTQMLPKVALSIFFGLMYLVCILKYSEPRVSKETSLKVP